MDKINNSSGGQPHASALSLEQELEHLSRLLHNARPPLGSPESDSLLALAQKMQRMIDPLTCTLCSTAFLHQLETEIYRVRRGRSELALVCFSLHGQEDITRLHGPEAVQLAHQALVLCLKECVLPCDCIGHISTGHNALILPGAGAFKAQAHIEKILKDCAGQGLRTPHGAFMPHFLAGIACASGSNALAKNLIHEALNALEKARNSSNFCAVHRDACPTNLYQTLVHSNEKRFLFSGGQ
ncbi:MAG: diguanylate cyclase [Desulfovibrionaceae bacterium]